MCSTRSGRFTKPDITMPISGRVNVNVAPLSVDEFKALRAEKIGTYQIFSRNLSSRTVQKKYTLAAKKMDYDFRVSALHRAMEAGIDDVGIGVLLGTVRTTVTTCWP